MTVVLLDPWEYEYALSVGARRHTANWGNADAPHYDRSRMEDDRTAQAAACVAELAVARFTNQYWSGHVWHRSEHQRYRDIADVGESIEVKRVRSLTNGAAVRQSQLGKGLTLWAAFPQPPEFRAVTLLGWLPYDTAWDVGTPSRYARGTRTVSREQLNSPLQWEHEPY